MKTLTFNRCLGVMLLLLGSSASAQTTTNRSWAYQLLEGSYLTEDCTFCGRPTIPRPMRGSFNLVLLGENTLAARYELQDISFTSGTNRLTGSGTFQIGGEVARLQQMKLDLQLNSQPINFTNADQIIRRKFPLIQISLGQTQSTLLFYTMDIVAAPFREIWFSTVAGFTSARGFSGNGGDLLSATGRIVKSNRDLISRLGFMPAVGAVGIDALDIAPGGEILFSLDQSRFSETLGQIQHGDLLSNRGRILWTNQSLLAAFQPSPAATDYGLDAVMVKDDGEVLFSVRSNVFSGRLGATLQRGDLLSNRGQIVKHNGELLAPFHPMVSKDAGLDAVYVWPSGEIWFSTEDGFQSLDFGSIQAGDLLSDQGLIVYHNLELLSAFAPAEDLSDFGLDALFVVTDVTPPAPRPNFTQIVPVPRAARSVSLEWQGLGRVFQVERSGVVTGPLVPLSPIQPDSTFDDVAFGAASFYRLRQW